MSPLQDFMAYAAAFEQAFSTDDWSVLDRHFTEDASYEVISSPPFASRSQGLAALKEHLRGSVNGLDRRFDTRAIEFLEGPRESADRVWFRWAAVYARAGLPDLRVEGEETVVFRGNRICVLEDHIPADSAERVMAYFGAHDARLKPSP